MARVLRQRGPSHACQLEHSLRMIGALLEPEVSQKPTPSRGSRWVILAVIGIASYGGYYAFDYIGPLAPLLSRQLHFSNSDIGLLQAIYSFPNIVMALVCGVIVDRIGTRKSLSIFGIFIVHWVGYHGPEPSFGCHGHWPSARWLGR